MLGLTGAYSTTAMPHAAPRRTLAHNARVWTAASMLASRTIWTKRTTARLSSAEKDAMTSAGVVAITDVETNAAITLQRSRALHAKYSTEMTPSDAAAMRSVDSPMPNNQ